MIIIKRLLLFILLIAIAIVINNHVISYQAKDKTYDTINNIPKNKVGLLLGTSKHLPNGNLNIYYQYRLDAAVALFNAKKIEFILVSGDNGSKNYDETSAFSADLIARGIPENKIFLDYAGFRTLDSVIRAKAIFGQHSLTIISQQFHNERAIYLAKHHGIKAIAFNAKDLKGRYGIPIHFREYFAKTKASIDVCFNVSPKFLGEKIEIK